VIIIETNVPPAEATHNKTFKVFLSYLTETKSMAAAMAVILDEQGSSSRAQSTISFQVNGSN
jgi:hypothetical protein